MLPLGLVALGVVGAVSSDYRRDLAQADALHNELAVRPCTDDDRTRMRELLAATRREEGVMIALGMTGGALVTAGTALLVRGERATPKGPTRARPAAESGRPHDRGGVLIMRRLLHHRCCSQ
jgi:hypothetical protein